MKNILHIISFITLLSAFILMLIFGFWFLYPYHPAEFTEDNFKVYPTEIKPGQNLTMVIPYCKYSSLPATIDQRFIDSLIYIRPTFSVDNPTGCHTIKVSVPIPYGLPPERYVIEQIVTYRVNPIREIKIMAHSESFQIVQGGETE